MNVRRRPLVLLYAIGSAIVVAALCALTVLVMRQQSEHARSIAEALHQEDVRTALWRMETRVSTLLALTTSRAAITPVAPGDYAANSIESFDNMINPSQPPPTDLQRELTAAADNAFSVACSMPGDPLSLAANVPSSQTWTHPEQQNISNRGVERSVDEFERRALSNLNSQVASGDVNSAGGAELLVGPLASRWDRSGATLGLQFARRIQGPLGASHASYRVEWDELSRLLLAEITDLFPTARLEPIETGGTPEPNNERAMRLAAVPARLVVPPPLQADALPNTHAWTLAGAWAALLFALAVGGFALRSSYAYGDKHRRFTHAVTHELRTPLTTFRLYSEMLARGMVPAASQPEYLATLEHESARLARLVDNVLRYARVEDGRRGPSLAPIDASELIERCVPELARICAGHEARLDVQDLVERDVRVKTDADAVLQVLSNLVENACKYGRSAADVSSPQPDAAIVLRCAIVERELTLDVCDRGPGIPSKFERAIFEPFERGGRDSSDRVPGVGLGLALSRALATDLGGSLTLVAADRGATFRLTLPL